MTTIQQVLGIAFLTTAPLVHAQELDKAEVRIPYSELKKLLARAEATTKPEVTPVVPKPALLSARLKLSIENGRPVIDATYRTVSYGNEMALVPLVSGGVSLEKQDPENAVIMIEKDSLCLATDQAGSHTLKLRLLPVLTGQAFKISLPPCPSTIFETGDLSADRSVAIKSFEQEQVLFSGRIIPLTHAGSTLVVRLLDSRETREASRPPEPSTWTWQHQALVIPAEGELIYQTLSRLSAAGGSGVEALLPMPSDAQDITVSGDDLVSHTKIRGDNRALGLTLVWKTRGILDRKISISYRIPLRPLDPAWHLQAPGDESTRTRFLIADSPLLSYRAEGLRGPLTSQGLPYAFAQEMKDGTCHYLEAATTAELTTETSESLRPPVPSTWIWQHQALVTPTDGDLTYQLISRSSAVDGSGVEALLPMPPDARDIVVSGEDLDSHSTIRGENRSLGLSLKWKTRGILDRQIGISYRMPLRPLDPEWHLQAPGDEDTRTRFIIADSPFLSYAADGLSGPLTSQGLPSALAELLNGGNCHQLEGETSIDLTVTSIPVAATAEGVVTNAEWSLRIEPDGAMLATGVMTIEHKSRLGFEFDTPEGMKILACDLGGKSVSPVDLGEGKLMVTLPPHGENSRLSCTFTGSITPLDPVEGTMKLSLPKVPLFIHSLLWSLDLPPGYQAETHGNLTRASTTSGPPSKISLRKNLCRDERPEIQVFYQRSDINR